MNRAWARIYLDEWIEKGFAFFSFYPLSLSLIIAFRHRYGRAPFPSLLLYIILPDELLATAAPTGSVFCVVVHHCRGDILAHIKHT